jgi:hypothetical protein
VNILDLLISKKLAVVEQLFIIFLDHAHYNFIAHQLVLYVGLRLVFANILIVGTVLRLLFYQRLGFPVYCSLVNSFLIINAAGCSIRLSVIENVFIVMADLVYV